MLIRTIIIAGMFLALLVSFPESLFAQRASRQIRQAEKKKVRQERVERRNFEKEKKRSLNEHISRQSPEVQERMKQNRRDSRRMNRPTQAAFYKRWFRKKPG